MSVKTLKSTLDQYRSSLPMDLVPLTFSQAMYMARKLGVRYLWIDSLCIIQDSEEDWLNESSVMGSIYSNSTCTLSATASKDSSGGLFRQRDSRRISPCILSYPSDTGISEGIVVHSPWSTLPDEMYELALYQDPLHDRGWVVQEGELSPRTIHFTTDQLIWRCWSQCACEARPHRALTPSLSWPKPSHSHLVNALHNNETSDPLLDWYSLISEYTGKKLTFGKDRLPAISALARKWQKITGDRYVAGLWESDLRRGLCWSRQWPGSDGTQRHMQYRAPSWSWVSMNFLCNWSSKVLEATFADELQILQVKVDATGLDPFGQLSDGFVRLSGHARWVSEGWCNGGVLSQISVDGSQSSFWPQWEFKTMQERRLYTGKGVVSPDGSLVPEPLGLLDLDYFEDLKNGIGEEVLLLRMAEEKPSRGESTGKTFALALLDVGRFAKASLASRAERNIPTKGIFFEHQPEVNGLLVERANRRFFRDEPELINDHQRRAARYEHVFRRIGYARINEDQRDWFNGLDPMEITVI